MTSLAIPTSISDGTQGAVPKQQGSSTRTSMTKLTKLPLQRLRPAVSKYLKVLDIHLHRLHQHQCNMEKLVKTESWTQLHAEQVNAARTVQQIKATLQELQRISSQVVDNQVGDFHAMVQEFCNQATISLDTFLFFCQGKQPEVDGSGESSVSPDPDSSVTSSTFQTSINTQGQMVTCTCSVPDNTSAACSRDQLIQETEELQAMVLHFVHAVTVTRAEAGESTQKHRSEIGPARSADSKMPAKTNKLKMAVMPVVGALLGGAVAGPVGVFTGIKIGTLAGTVGGGVAGLASGTIFNSQNKTPAKAPDVNHNTAEKVQESTPQTPSTPRPPITQQLSEQQTSSISVSSSTQSASQTLPAQSHMDNRCDQPCTDNSDGNGNVSWWNHILF